VNYHVDNLILLVSIAWQDQLIKHANFGMLHPDNV